MLESILYASVTWQRNQMQDNGFSALGVLGFRMVRSKEGEAVAKAV